MKSIRQYACMFFLTAILLLIAVYWASETDVPLPRFVIENQDDSDAKEISIYDAGDGSCYVFLPSYASMEQVTISLPADDRFALNNTPLSHGMTCADFALETPYAFSVNDKELATLWFYQSENVASMFIETDSGHMAYIHGDQSHEENSSVKLYTAGGAIDYTSRHCTIKGRGNSSWGYDKKPYALKLEADENLLGMAKAANWVLLANAIDETNLNNKLVFSLAQRVGFPWTPDSQWVDLYLNGEYSGLYLLTEKVEVSQTRLNLDAGAGDFLCKIDLHDRWSTLRNPFLTPSGRAVEINAPQILTPAEADRIQSCVNQMEQTLLSGQDLRLSDHIDLDSWVRRYLIDEISANIDSDSASSYFYWTDGKLFAGPIWDYDMALGNCTRNQEAHALIARHPQTPQTTASPYYRALYANESFNSRMRELYRTEFVPVLQQMIDTEIASLSSLICKASQANSIRWRAMYDTVQSWYPYAVRTAEGITDYLSRRVSFLSSAWIGGEDYCTVQFRPAHTSPSWNISLKTGSTLKTDYLDIVSTVWIDAETGKPFDFHQPVTKDTLLLKQAEAETSSHYSIGMGDYITFASIAALLILLTGLAVTDAARRRKEKRQ